MVQHTCDQTFKNISCEAKPPMLTVRLWRQGPTPMDPVWASLVSEKPWYPAVWRMISLFSCWICRFYEIIELWGIVCESSVSFFFLKQYVILHNYWVQNWDQLLVALGVQEGHILTILGVLKYDFCIDHGFSNNEDCIFWYISHFLYRGKRIGDCPYWCTDNRCQLDIIEGRILVSCSPAPSSSCRVTAHWLLYCIVELEQKQKLFWNPYGKRNGIR